ncbi:hypothetical protein [uncultured Lutibacter sp.]|uniref:hypothetical protein n=1 Tax=uncultured Lutibacter sp. TaxID=437739 RepID=UPI00261A8175|nr:hypothetical protein [uncultured Lutibacter sp.]
MKRKDLHKIAPKLSEISLEKVGFEIPENYFDSIEDAVIAELKSENLLKKETEKTFKTPENYFNSIEDIVLAKLKAAAIQNNTESTIPKNYFDTLEDQVLSKIKTTPKVISLKSRFIKFVVPIGIAASLLLFFVLNNNSAPLTFESLASSEIETWIDNGNIDIDALSIASIYPEIELKSDIYSSSLSDDEVLEYLNDEDLENLIYEN